MRHSTSRSKEGFTLIEAVIVSALLAMLAFAVLKSSMVVRQSLRSSQHHTAATNLLKQQVETIRGMDYYRLGIHPDNNLVYINAMVATNDSYDATEDILMTNSVVLNDMGTPTRSDDLTGLISVRAWVVDDAFDGIGASDADGKLDDYTKIQVDLTWSDQGRSITRNCETFAYGTISDDMDPPPVDTTPDEGDPDGAIVISKAEYTYKDSKLKVEANTDEEGTPILRVTGYFAMNYDSKKNKYKYEEKGVVDPGGTVTVTSSAGSSATHSVQYKNK